MSRINIGVVGAGFIANDAHIPNYIDHPKVNLIGVADKDKNKLTEVKKRFGLKSLYTDYHDLFESGIDAVSICVPTRHHCVVATEAAKKGIHVLCEKPLALTLAEADKMIKECKDNNVKLMVGFNLRFMKNHQIAREYIKNQKIGEPYLAHGQFAVAGPYSETISNPQSFYFDPKSGGGVLFDTAPHLIDLLRWFMGDVTSVKAEVGTHKDDVNIDDHAALVLRFSNNALGVATTIWTKSGNWSSMNNEGFVKVFGTKGKVSSDYLGPTLKYYCDDSRICRHKGSVELTPRKFDPKVPFQLYRRSTYDQIDAFVSSIQDDEPPLIPGEEGRKNLEVVLKAYQSAKSGKDMNIKGKEAI